MSKGIVVVGGFGTGNSAAIATKFGSEGFKLALISRTQSKLDAAAAEFGKSGIVAKGFAADLSDSDSVKATLAKVRSDFGPITIIFWNPYGGSGSLLEVSQDALVHEFKLDVTGLVAAVQATYEDLKAQAGKSAVLVTGGGLSLENDQSTQVAIDWGAVTFATAKAAQRKLVDIMNKQLSKDGIYVAEVTVLGLVKGTPFDDGKTQLTAEMVADKFWEIYSTRDLAVWNVPLLGP